MAANSSPIGAGPNVLLAKSFEATAAIGINDVVKWATATTVTTNAAATTVGIGVALNAAAAAGDRVDVQMAGIAICRASAGITGGTFVTGAADGEIATAAADNMAIGIALETAAAANDLIPVLLCPHMTEVA